MKTKTKNALVLIAQIVLTVATAVASVSLVYYLLDADNEPKSEAVEEPTRFEYEEPKDWFLDSTLTEQQHIYYETQHKMKSYE